MVINLSAQAKKDLKNIHSFIKKDSSYSAVLVTDTILEKISILKKYPEIGRVVLRKNQIVLRQILVYKFRIIYLVREDSIEIVTIHHSAKLLDNNPGLTQYFDE